MIRTQPHNTPAVMVVDDQRPARESLVDAVTMLGFEAISCGSGSEAVKQLERRDISVVITDLQMPGMDGLELIRGIRQKSREIQIVMVTAHGTIGTVVEAMRYGALDYLQKPIGMEALESALNRAMEASRRGDHPTTIPPGGDSDQVAMIGESRPMRNLREQITRIAPTDETILITGESGTGKELVARTVHHMSRRAQRALISLNCPVLSAQLMESELFGHERGAFTSADQARIGRFELADQGTMLLDEISEIDPALQAKLLRVLQEKQYEKVGSSQTIRCDVRVLATSNRDLQAEVAAGRFREDLYYRLAVVPLQLPPLRSRTDDIPALVAHFLTAANTRIGVETPIEVEDSAIELLQAHAWPGNVRELENIVTRGCLLAVEGKITADQLRPWLCGDAAASPSGEALELPVGTKLETMERQMIERTLETFAGHRERTAEALGISIRTLSNKLRAYGVAPRAKSFA